MATQRARRRDFSLPIPTVESSKQTLTHLLYAQGFAERCVQQWKDIHPGFTMEGEGATFHLLAPSGAELWFD